MISARSVRLLTSLLVLGLLLQPFFAGAGVLSVLYRGTAEPLSEAPAAAIILRRQTLQWTDTPASRQHVASLLQREPLSTSLWLRMAEAETIETGDAERINAYLALSYLTGPNEGAFQLRRAAFAFGVWSELPTQIRRGVSIDMSEIYSSLSDAERNLLKKALARMAMEDRQSLQAALLLLPKRNNEMLDELGLAVQLRTIK
jgi:hypothetical protein